MKHPWRDGWLSTRQQGAWPCEKTARQCVLESPSQDGGSTEEKEAGTAQPSPAWQGLENARQRAMGVSVRPGSHLCSQPPGS